MKKALIKVEYVEPQVEIIEVIVENGFASSPGDGESEGTEDEDWGL